MRAILHWSVFSRIVIRSLKATSYWSFFLQLFFLNIRRKKGSLTAKTLTLQDETFVTQITNSNRCAHYICRRSYSAQPQNHCIMFGKGSIFYSVTRNKCPRCQSGDFFAQSNPYHLASFTKMHDECSHCGLHYELEPGFFYGSMYVSYAFNIAWFVTVWVATTVLFPEMNKMLQFAVVAVTLLALFPISYRYARLLYTNLFVRYKKKSEIQS